ncbi:MAG: hypothetical protein V3T84_14590 [Phycisphaerales bacterium]
MDYTNRADELLAAAAAEGRVAVFSGLADDLLAQIEDADAVTGELLRNEAVRLLGICHEIVHLLSLGDIKAAHRLSVGNADEGGDVLGVAV